jgi:hypothetical protein
MKKVLFPQNGWQIKDTKTGKEYHSDIPTSVQDVLIKSGVLSEEARIGNTDINWIADQDWAYTADFLYDGDTSGARGELCLKGIDIFADIYFNDQLLDSTGNMFLQKRFDVSAFLKKENSVTIYFHSVLKKIKELEAEYAREGLETDGTRLLRKAVTDFGNFIGNKVVLTCVGLFDDVTLNINEDKIWISDFSVDYDLSYDLKSVTLKAEAEIHSETGPALTARFRVTDPGGRAILEKDCPVTNGRVSLNEELKNPLLWWPLHFGKQNLYEISLSVLCQNKEADTVRKRTGFRKIIYGDNFYFEVNGRRVRIWGSNLVNFDGISHYCDRERVRKTVEYAEQANMNILRFWAENAPFPDYFYDLADERGIFIWQDFYLGGLFNFGVYPKDESWHTQYCLEVEQAVTRLKDHPSILLWCGSNELTLAGTCEYEEARYKGFDLIYKDGAEICARLDPERLYIPSTPIGGAYPQDPKGGDMHGYWGNDFEAGIKYPVLFSESCHATTYSRHSMLKFMTPEEIWPKDYHDTHVYKMDFSEVEKNGRDRKLCYKNYWRQISVPETWEPHLSGFAASELWHLERYFSASDMNSILYKYSVCGADFYKDEIERIRRGRPCNEALVTDRLCSGYMTWKFNDAFPHINFTLIDYYLEPTAQYYAVKKAYAPLLAGVAEETGHLYLYCVNDSPYDFSGSVVLRIFSRIRNKIECEYSFPVMVRRDESKVIDRLDWLGPLHREYILHTELINQKGGQEAVNITYLDMERNLSFPDPVLTLSWDKGCLVVQTDKYARYVELTGLDGDDEFGWNFDDNYFDLLPFEKKRIKVSGVHKKGKITAKAQYGSKTSEIEYCV